MSSAIEFPPHQPLDLASVPKLTREQAGHLRHYYNITSGLDGEWPHMGFESDFGDAYRFQLAEMTYASSLAHFHRLPALRGVFKPLIRRMISKMLLPECWNYWYLTSQSGVIPDPDIKELRKPYADPVVKENIMYSGHLLLMTSLYGMLFDDDEFEKPNSITFTWNPIVWGFGPEVFKYDNRSLQKVIITQMEENGWIGCCCEPNMIFVVCNQYQVRPRDN